MMTEPMNGALLLGGGYYGTLAAVRTLGAAGVPVYAADASTRGPALHSRHVSERLVHPDVTDVSAFMKWLIAFGDSHPGTVLYPTNDHLAWLFALHREELGRHFLMYQPPESVILTLLDKKRLAIACTAVGIETPRTLYAESDDDVARVQNEASFPLLIKPRTQVFLESGVKGLLVGSSAELRARLEHYASLIGFHKVLTDVHPEIARPLFQEYLAAAETSIISVSGFVTRDGDLICRASMKVLQRPRKLGIGLCFEGRAVEPTLRDKLAALCRHVGYHGAFEAEFIVSGSARLLIDFNPRFFSQMAFDVARGLPIPLLAYHAARGDTPALRALLERARNEDEHIDYGYCHRSMLGLILALQRVSGRLSSAEVAHWRAWVRERAGRLTDAVTAADDRMPGLADTASWARHFLKHPRSFVQNFVMNR